MARYKRGSPRQFEKTPGLYARTSDTYTTRYYQRKGDKLFNLLGLDTAHDDYHKREGSSPYLTNVRFMGEREGDQRAQVMSRKGAKHIDTIGESTIVPNEQSAQAYLELFEGKAIQWELNHNRRLSGINLHLFNVDQVSGFVKVTVRNIDTQAELSNAVIDLSKVNTRRYDNYRVRFMNTVRDSRVLLRLEILDDVLETEDRTESRERRSIRILTEYSGTHDSAEYSLPNVDSSLREVKFEFNTAPTRPVTGTTLNDWQPMVRSEDVMIGGQLHVIFPVRHDGIVELFKTNLVTGQTSSVTTLVDPRSKAVRFDQAEGFLYYVDEYSPLRRISLTTLVVELVIPKREELQQTTIVGNNETEKAASAAKLIKQLTAKEGASLIMFMQNRLYLSGFKDDPNLVIYSLIDDVKPRFEQYNDRLYSPDQSPELSAGSPITALSQTSNVLVIFRIDAISLYTPGLGIELNATQATPEGAALGVLNQEAVCSGKNNVYFYNPIEGLMRFAGSLNRVVSADIENMFKRIAHPENIFMLYQNKRVRMYFSFTETTNDSCFYYYTELEGSLPWYLDVNTPVSSAIASKRSEGIIAIHSQVPSIMDVDSQFTDFDSYIVMEYHTQYETPADIDGWLFVRRVHVHELANSTHSMYIALDIDHTDKPITYRRVIERTVQPEYNPDAVFQNTAEDGVQIVSLHMYVRCRSFQVRIKRYCYKDTAEFLGVSVEYGDKAAL